MPGNSSATGQIEGSPALDTLTLWNDDIWCCQRSPATGQLIGSPSLYMLPPMTKDVWDPYDVSYVPCLNIHDTDALM